MSLICRLLLVRIMSDVYFKLPKSLADVVRMIPKTGAYESESEFMKDAVKTLLMARADVRASLAVELYREGIISIGRVSELTDLDYEGAKKMLVKKGIKIRRGPSNAGELKKGAKKLFDAGK